MRVARWLVVASGVLLISIVCVGCATSGAVRTGVDSYPATKAADVRVFLRRADVPTAFEEIGYVTAQKTAGWTFTNVAEDKVVAVLCKQAAKIGADAIILEGVSGDSVPWAVVGAGSASSLDRKSGRATAIKFKK